MNGKILQMFLVLDLLRVYWELDAKGSYVLVYEESDRTL